MPCRYQAREKKPDRSDVGELLPNNVGELLPNKCHHHHADASENELTHSRINVTTENVSQLHLCLLQEELKLQAIVTKVDNFREKWMGKDNINRQQPLRVNVRCLALMLNNKATRGRLLMAVSL